MGERKGMKQHIIRFISEVDELLLQIGNKTFYSASKEYREDTIKTLDRFWKKACKIYFNNEEGKAVFARLIKNNNKNKTQSCNAVIPFGP